MKKRIIFMLSVLLTLSLSACSSAAQLSGVSGGSASGSGENVSEAGVISGERMEDKGTDTGSLSESYAVGDIILEDGAVVKAEELTGIDRDNVPAAVVVEVKNDGSVLGVGVHRSEAPLPWALDGTAGISTQFADIVCTQENADGEASADYIGDTDGSDNWDVICAGDPQGASEAARNYPAFDFVNTYAETCGLSGEYSSGWYLPSIAELYVVYENREAVNTSLQKIYGLDCDAAMDGLGTNWYWSSSQSASAHDYAWFVHYYNGYACDCLKNFTNLHVLAVRRF